MPRRTLSRQCIGRIGVDSGTIVFADPAHVELWNLEHEAQRTIGEQVADLVGPAGNQLGMIVATNIGDGYFPVWGMVDEDGAVHEIRISFDRP